MPPEQSPWGRPVVQISLECDAPLKLEDFREQITQKVGDPLDPSKISESLKKLFATGRFTELEARAEPQDGGVELIFSGRAQFFVGVVEVEGTPKPLDPRVVLDAAGLRLGQPLFEDDLAAAEGRIARVLADNAYYQPRIGHRLSQHPDDQEVDVLFSVSPGRPARLSDVHFEGHVFLPPARLAAIASWRAGEQLTSSRLEGGLLKIHQYYAARGRLQSTANLQKRIYDPRSHTESLQVKVEAGPLVRVSVEGARVSSSELKELLPVFRDGVADDPALQRGERALEDHFNRQGYFSAAVTSQRVDHPESGTLDIAYRVSLGKQEEFAGYGFEGNRAVTTRELAAVLAEKSNAPSGGRKIFSQELLASQVYALAELYKSRGFLEAQVAPHLNDHDGGQGGRLFVTFEIEEGPPTRLGRLSLRGVTPQMEKELRPHLFSKPGGPYSPTSAETDRDFLLNYFADHGYSRAAVEWRASPVSPAHEVDLEYQAELNPQERIARVVVMGNEHTRVGIIRREILFRKGDPVRQSELLETQRRLYDLGIFTQVQIAMQDPQSAETERTALVSVEEARRWTVGYGGGLEVQRLGSNQPQGQFKASPRLSLDLTRLNVDGRDQTLTLRGRLSYLDEGGGASYLIPRLPARRDLSLRLDGLADRSRDVLTFTAEREEGSVSIEKHYSPGTLLLGRYSYRRVLVDPSTLRISPQSIPLLSRPARVAMLGASYLTDHRDNPADAARGSLSLADAGVSWGKVGSEATFLRLSGQNASYLPLGSHFVFARNTRFAVESPFGGLRSVFVSGGNLPAGIVKTHDIPLPERFFLGGSESHRGFSINQAGPRDLVTGFPIGGNALFLNSLELRTRMGEKRFGFVIFHDAGNVYSTIRKMRLLKVMQSSPADFDYTAHALGTGVRYRTPVGPLRFDVGYNLNPPRFQVNVPGGVEVRRLSQFQFFLSVGQSF